MNFVFGSIIIASVVGVLLVIVVRREGLAKERLSEAVRQTQEKYSLAARFGRTAQWEILVQERKILADENLSFLVGIEGGAPASTIGEWAAHILPEDVDLMAAARQRIAAGQTETLSVEYRIQDKEGNIRWMLAEGQVSERIDGVPTRIAGMTRDLTEQKNAEESLRATEQRVSAILQNVAESLLTIDEAGVILSANPAFSKTFGYSVDEVTGKDVTMIMPEPYRSGHTGYMNHYFESGVSQILGKAPRELEAVDKDGRVFPIELMIGEATIGNQRVFIGSMRDVSERKIVEERLARSRKQLRDAHQIARLGHWKFDIATQRFTAYGGVFDKIGMGGDDTEFSFEAALQAIHPEDMERVRAAFEASFAEGVPYDETNRVVYDDGRIGHMRLIGEVVRDATGTVVEMWGTTQDITEQKEAEEALRESERHLAWAQDKARLGSWERKLATGAAVWSDQLYRILDIDSDTPLNSGQLFYQFVHPADVESLTQSIASLVDTGEPMNVEYRIQSALGHEKTVRGYGELIYDGSGNPITIGGTVQDVTALRQAEQQLQQAQKMETVGQLSAGVAHDFNNLLAVISGNLELAKARLSADSDLRGMLEAAFGASQRGADLTGRLLAYSRRQTLTPQPTDINALTEHMLGLARRTLGEAVEVVFEPAEGAWWAHVDPSQLENALLNLAINARDAMPDGGTLTIRTENVSTRGKTLSTSEALSAGEYVLVEVADSGTGMSEEVREKVFEPFFTTKEMGEGSGLGLSMVYGFARQSGGHVDIESTVGEGTTIHLYLPRSEQSSQDASEMQTSTREVRSSGETVLIVEDDPHVRELVVSLVVSLGYIVLEAGDASSALEVMENGTQVDLLLSDVILGKGMNGVELANQVRESCPDTKVLLMSGYAREAFTQEDGLGDIYELISKPFKMADLAQHIEVLLH